MNYVQQYAAFLKQFTNLPTKIRVLFDCSNGSTPPVLKELFQNNEKVEAFFVNDTMDGDFPGHGPNPLDPSVSTFMQSEIQKVGVDVGMVFDGDGDRVFFFDNLGAPLDAYEVLGYIKKYFKPPYVVDVRALSKFTMPKEDIIETKVGRYFVAKTMQKHGAELGAEYSGHFYFKDFFYTDSGILAAIHFLNYVSEVKQANQSLSDIQKEAQFTRLIETNLTVSSVQSALNLIKEHFGKQGDIEEVDGVSIYSKDFALNLRGSATEPVMRFSLVAKDEARLGLIAEEVKQLLKTNE